MDLLWIHCPQASFPLVGSIGRRLFDLLKALVKREVVSDRIFPSIRRCFEVRKVFTEKLDESVLKDLVRSVRQQFHNNPLQVRYTGKLRPWENR